ncbi:MAG: hypothetical protein JWN87_2984, partial [Frankiales bacterium]|nr:hypothetical protein [Frankiales bacterium]
MTREQHLYVDGAWVPLTATFAVHDPWDGSLVGRVALGGAAEATAAVDAAVAAPALPAHERAAVLRRTA